MTITQFLSHLRSLNIRLWLDGDKLCYKAPEGAITPDLRADLIFRKKDIIAFLQEASAGVRSLSPITPVARNQALPLSFAQQQLWFLDRLIPGAALYNVPVAWRLTGQLDLLALRQSLDEIVRRHDILRTVFSTQDEHPVQIVLPTLTIPMPIIDLTGLGDQAREAQRLVDAAAQRPFDLTRGPLLRLALLRLGQQEHILLVTMHHIITDGWSMGVLIRELGALYLAFSQGQPSPLPALPIQYADFAAWQRERLQGDELDQQLAYWKQQLQGTLPTLDLPFARPRPAVQTFRGAACSFTLSQALTQALAALCRQEGTTMFVVLLAAFKALLFRYTGQNDLLVGTVVANRGRSETEGLIGYFVNTLVLRTDLGGRPCFRELIGRMRQVALDAYAHQDVPFEQIVRAVHPERDMSRQTLFQITFTYQDASTLTLNLPGMSVDFVGAETHTAKFDMSLIMGNTGQQLAGSLDYNTDLFDESMITRMLGHFQTLLESLVANPEHPLDMTSLLTDAERRQLLVDWNDTQANFPHAHCIHQLFEAWAERTPDAVAVVFEQEGLTFEALDRRSNQLARYLSKLGVGPEVLVGICVERSLEMVVGCLGIWKAGGAYVPFDPVYPLERLAQMYQDAQLSILLTQERLLNKTPVPATSVVCLDRDWGKITQESEKKPDCGVAPENLAYVIYTSGSTGKPKGVLVPHYGLCNVLEAQVQTFGINPNDHILQLASLSFDASVAEMVMALGTGAMLCMGTRESLLPGPGLIRLLQDKAVTIITLTPSALASLPVQVLDALRIINVAGEACSAELVTRWANGIQFFNLYGPTENTIWATAARCTCGDDEPPIGRPIANTQVYLLDSHLQPVPVGVPGELCLGGVGVARGYLCRPDLTAERFIPNPFAGQNAVREDGKVKNTGSPFFSPPSSLRLYKTGDLARWQPDGNLEFIGRIDHQVKVRGFRIELGEVEAVLRQHPDVREVAVIARDAEGRPGNKRLIAYVVLCEEELPASELREYLKAILPDYMIPSAFVILGALPLMPNGKLDRTALPPPPSALLEGSYVAPRDWIELQLAQIWEDILSIAPIGITDGFFELGGHSLLAIRLVTRVQKQFGKEIPLALLFQRTTIEQLALVLRQQTVSQPCSPLVGLRPAGRRYPFFCVHAAGGTVFGYIDLVRYLDSEQPFYGLQAMGGEGELAGARIEDMAKRYIQAIRTVQPQGPYLLGGWSLGGVVAFEMAQQIMAQGQAVALLALMDSYAPTGEGRSNGDHTALVKTFALNLGVLLDPRDSDSSSFDQLESGEQLRYVLEQAKQLNVVPPDMEWGSIRSLFQVFKNNLEAQSCYAPSLYRGAITLFKANELVEGVEAIEDLGWAPLAAQGLTVITVPGNHFTMMHPPQVQVLAKHMEEQLTACQG